MRERPEKLIPTRQSLLEPLEHSHDQESWRDVFNTYRGLLYRTAVKSGPNDSEAQNVVQDAIIVVAKMLHSFRYDSTVDADDALRCNGRPSARRIRAELPTDRMRDCFDRAGPVRCLGQL